MDVSDPRLESLEPRTLLSSAVVRDKKLTIRGDTDTPNNITVSLDAKKKNVLVDINGTAFSFKKDNVEHVNIVGGNQDDTILIDETTVQFGIPTRVFGEAGNDTITTGKERDEIFGDDGNDTINSGKGDDTIIGGNGDDVITTGGAFKLIFAGAGNDTITTGNGRGYIFGEDGNDSITTAGDEFEILGNAGNDTLTGHGRDTLWGGGGADVLSGGEESHPGEVPGIFKIMELLRPTRPTKINGQPV
jgi:Ca2+-binding RTX toxin-like protein